MKVVRKKVKEQGSTQLRETSLAKAVNQQWERLGLTCERYGMLNLVTILSMGLRESLKISKKVIDL